MTDRRPAHGIQPGDRQPAAAAEENLVLAELMPPLRSDVPLNASAAVLGHPPTLSLPDGEHVDRVTTGDLIGQLQASFLRRPAEAINDDADDLSL